MFCLIFLDFPNSCKEYKELQEGNNQAQKEEEEVYCFVIENFIEYTAYNKD